MSNSLKPLNLVFVGDWNIGQKILNSFSEKSTKCKTYDKNSIPPLITMQINSNTNVKFWIYNAGTKTGAGSSIQAFANSESASAVLIVYNKTDKESFEKVKKTLNDVNNYYPNIFKGIIVDNGFDKENGDITDKEMKEVEEKCSADSYAVDDNNFTELEKLFIKIAEKVLDIKVDEEPIKKKDFDQLNIQMDSIFNKKYLISKICNVLFVGDWSIGQKILNLFSDKSTKFIGYDKTSNPAFITLKINDNTITKFWIYDAGTITGPGSFIKGYSENIFFSAVFITYDNTDKDSFDNVKKTLDEVNTYYPNIFKGIIVYNGFIKENGKVTEEELNEVKEKCSANSYAVDDKNITELENLSIKIAEKVSKKVKVKNRDKKKSQGCCCSQ